MNKYCKTKMRKKKKELSVMILTHSGCSRGDWGETSLRTDSDREWANILTFLSTSMMINVNLASSRKGFTCSFLQPTATNMWWWLMKTFITVIPASLINIKKHGIHTLLLNYLYFIVLINLIRWLADKTGQQRITDFITTNTISI